MYRASGWSEARKAWSPAWLLLSEEQKAWIDRRVAWVDSYQHTYTITVRVAKEPSNECAEWSPPGVSAVVEFLRDSTASRETDDGWEIIDIY